MKAHLKLFLSMALALPLPSAAQYAWQADAEAGRLDLGKGITYKAELEGSFSHGKTPLWLNANRYGLSSLEQENGYLRGALIRPLATDTTRRWGVGYGVDIAVPLHYTSKVVLQQAFVEARWLHGVLTVGSKEFPMELKNQQLSSGSQTLGINARPVPQVRLALPEYWVLPFANSWLRIKGHIAYGRLTDDNWQHEFAAGKNKYSDNVLYHSKAGYLMIGNPDRFFPWSLELGLEMASTFGGTIYAPKGDGTMNVMKGGTGLGDFWRAFMPGGGEVIEQGTAYQNAEGNQLGSWVARLNYDADTWRLGLYADKFFEDHSAMLQLDYDGYGTGEEWNVKKKHRYFVYDFKDWLLGMELNFKYNRWIRDVVVEYLYTKYQSGPVYHDHTPASPAHISGQDNYYNHHIYNGWQHWGQAIGNPLYRSPLYNDDGSISFKDNRFVAFHLGLDGAPAERVAYRVLATYQKGFGSYAYPYSKKHHNVSFMTEVTCHLNHDWHIRGAYGMDFGHILGHNYGFQLTVSKTGILNFKSRQR